ncbi:MAG: bifunctional sulfate adenylyltransferase/adenylylsulfate kinase [Gammaproteobacteria bacterium]|nr:bifunctional sulfate adenylyltransferase/adenylylsulfate kinase [Gammaproteobacteria bacterium]
MEVKDQKNKPIHEHSLISFPHSLEYYQSNAQALPQLILTQRQLCDLELILNGGFDPLHSFLNQDDYHHVLDDMHLANGMLWPVPINLDVDQSFHDSLKLGDEIALRDPEGLLLAIMKVNESWQVDRSREALSVFGTLDMLHPGVHYLYHYVKDFYIAGPLLKLALPHHYDFNHLRYSPSELRQFFQENQWEKVVGFQTRNPMHRAHQELTLRAAQQTGAHVLLHPVVGMTKPGDIEYYIRVRCYEHILQTYPPDRVKLSLLPLAMRMAGPKEAIFHALIRKNYGCTHFIVGRDHAGPGKDSKGNAFYQPYAAQELALSLESTLGIHIIPFQEMVYSAKSQQYFPIDQFPKDEKPETISGTDLRDRLQKNADIPSWFSYPAVITELRKAHPPKHEQGLTLFFTGLPSSGKSTLANGVALRLREVTHRQISLLDGDIIRTHLSAGLSFSREDRETNVTRVGFVAREITKHGGIAICALVSPFQNAREKVRDMVSEVGGFIEIYVATPLEICEERDRKGLYKKAREGIIKQFTGISDPYEAPLTAEISIDTNNQSPHDIVDQIMQTIQSLGYIA